MVQGPQKAPKIRRSTAGRVRYTFIQLYVFVYLNSLIIRPSLSPARDPGLSPRILFGHMIRARNKSLSYHGGSWLPFWELWGLILGAKIVHFGYLGGPWHTEKNSPEKYLKKVSAYPMAGLHFGVHFGIIFQYLFDRCFSKCF